MGDSAQAPAGRPDALALVLARNRFYRSGYSALVVLVLVEIVIVLALAWAIHVALGLRHPVLRYVPLDANGIPVLLTPLASRDFSDEAVVNWAGRAVNETLTLGFHDFRARLQSARGYFTPGGYDLLMKAFTDANFIKDIVANKFVVQVTQRSAPVILDQGVAAGLYRWTVQVPVTVTFDTDRTQTRQNQTITLLLVRQDRISTKDGIAIQQWIGRPDTQ